MAENTQNNSRKLIEHCITNDKIATNTYYQKPKHKLATHMEVGTTREMEIKRQTHEQIDFITIQRRWRNVIKYIETQTTPNIKSDHYPLIAKIRLILKGKRKGGTPRKKYAQCNEEQKEAYNEGVEEDIREWRRRRGGQEERETLEETIETRTEIQQQRQTQQDRQQQQQQTQQTTQQQPSRAAGCCQSFTGELGGWQGPAIASLNNTTGGPSVDGIPQVTPKRKKRTRK